MLCRSGCSYAPAPGATHDHITHNNIVTYHFCAGIDDLQEVLAMLVDVSSRWKELGLALHLKKPTLDNIYEDHREVSKCKMEMLSSWLQQAAADFEVTCNWWSLAKALRDPTVNHKPIAEAIEKKYIFTTID